MAAPWRTHVSGSRASIAQPAPVSRNWSHAQVFWAEPALVARVQPEKWPRFSDQLHANSKCRHPKAPRGAAPEAPEVGIRRANKDVIPCAVQCATLRCRHGTSSNWIKIPEQHSGTAYRSASGMTTPGARSAPEGALAVSDQLHAHEDVGIRRANKHVIPCAAQCATLRCRHGTSCNWIKIPEQHSGTAYRSASGMTVRVRVGTRRRTRKAPGARVQPEKCVAVFGSAARATKMSAPEGALKERAAPSRNLPLSAVYLPMQAMVTSRPSKCRRPWRDQCRAPSSHR